MLRSCLGHASRLALLLVNKDLAIGVCGAGGLSNDEVRDLVIPLTAPSVLATVRDTGRPYVGPMTGTTTDLIVAACLGCDKAPRIALLPVPNGVDPKALLYADDVGGTPLSDDLRDLADLAEELSRLALGQLLTP